MDIYNATQAAKAVGVSAPTIQRYIKQGIIKASTLQFPSGRKRHKIPRAELERVFGVDLSGDKEGPNAIH